MKSLIALFVRHPVAANVLMLIMVLLGILSLSKLNAQFFPSFTLDVVTIKTVWVGASPEDVETSITTPLEESLDEVDNVKKMTSTSALGVSVIVLEFVDGANMVEAVDQVRQKVAEVTVLPDDAETPTVEKAARYDTIARISLIGHGHTLDELRRLGDEYRSQLLNRGIAKVDVDGIPQLRYDLEVSPLALQAHQMSLGQLATQVAASSLDMPAGSQGNRDAVQNLRSLNKQDSLQGLENLPILHHSGQRLTLGQLASAQSTWVSTDTSITVKGNPSIELTLKRTEDENTLKVAKLMNAWVVETRPQLPQGIELVVHDETWTLLQERIDLLLVNGAQGLIIVVLVLYLFLAGRVAFWVAVGIPVSFMAGLFILYAMGGTINMISLFALIMTLGIVVDDAIVVGEDAMSLREAGMTPLNAAETAANRMFVPVTASVLTTLVTFIPLMMVPGVIGNILIDIPFVVITVLLAALLECFLVLPEHLRVSLVKVKVGEQGGIREKLDHIFDGFRDKVFQPMAAWTLSHRRLTLAATFALMLSVIGLLAGGRVGFVFFPEPPGRNINASVLFDSATPVEEVNAYLKTVEERLIAVNTSYDRPVVKFYQMVYFNAASKRGGEVRAELNSPDDRSITNEQFVKDWLKGLPEVPGLVSLKVAERRSGPPGQDIQIRFAGGDASTLKAASLELQEVLKGVKGVLNVEDDLPYGRDSVILNLTPAGVQLGFSLQSLVAQVGQLTNGVKSYSFADSVGTLEVWLKMDPDYVDATGKFAQLPVQTPSGTWVPLNQVATWQVQKGFDAMRHQEGDLSIQVYADVDKNQNNANDILKLMMADTLPLITQKYGLYYSLEGRAADQKETLGGMVTGLMLGLTLIYLILALVFGSWGWPLLVMMAIPFGLIGAILGHYWMGMSMTILSLFGFFALSGIVVNASIILVAFYKRLVSEGMDVQEALLAASVQRLRPVLLTSLTTIGGLLPLMFETSFQAQFLIPMAVAISFGLMFSTFLVLLVIPAMLSVYEQFFGSAHKMAVHVSHVESHT